MTGKDSEIVMLCVDPQWDFCHESPKGNLYVDGAQEDMIRLAAAIKKHKSVIDRIVCTTDAHRYLHVAHPVWWVDTYGNHPNPFTEISTSDVTGTNPKWKAHNPGYQSKSVEYIKSLESQGNYKLMIWPPHCLISSNGFQVEPCLFEAFCEWKSQFATVDYITKGSNIFTEHYSAFKAEVFDPTDAVGTGPNMALVQYLENAKRIYIAGEASSHCVRGDGDVY